MHQIRRNMLVISVSALALSPLVIFAWTGPTQSPPGGNVAAPINVGTTDQVKDGSIGVNGLAVFGNSLFGGFTGSNAYLNFGATTGTNGYGIRDNAGLLEFKNSGGSWESIQAAVFNLVGGAGSWTVSGNNIYTTDKKVGIGTTNPLDQLHLRETNGSSDTEIWLEYSGSQGGTAMTYSMGVFKDGQFQLRDRTGNAVLLRMDSLLFDVSTDVSLGTPGIIIPRGNSTIMGIRPKATNGSIWITDDSNLATRGLVVANGGNVGIGTASPAAKLDIAGTVNASGGYTQNSDARLKSNIQPLDSGAGLVAIGKLQPVSFDWRDSGMGNTRQYGFIAQDVQEIFANLVSRGARTTYAPDGTLTLNYEGFIAPLVKALQEQQTEIESLKRDIEELRSAASSGR